VQYSWHDCLQASCRVCTSCYPLLLRLLLLLWLLSPSLLLQVLASTEERSASDFRAKELRLVQGQQLLLQPDVKIRVEPIQQ
jgi:hypothetical protein